MKELGTAEEELVALRAAFEGVPIGAPVWLFNHKILLGVLLITIEERIGEIQRKKPAEQHARRYREMRPVVGKLPSKVEQACAEWDKARAEWAKTYAELAKARAEWDKVCVAHQPELEAMHRAECPDSAWNGKSLFPDYA